ncbi:RagB/SusD family nutrient uptake outer membrane protein [Sphingobacterium sp. HJSM2_6]|uniref:RagB/SusD family nutrient uptake outer membrane protein n=1 Tax=Sphingobacterium sp. HJSM2_6 TaxID=3366264 RepID=UPI003BD79B34
MKKIFYPIIALLLSSCSNDFLNLYPETSLNESNYYKTDAEFVSLVNGSYIPMRNLAKTVQWDVSEIKSDNMDLQPSNTNIEQSRNDNFLMSSASIVHKSLWDNSYKGIYYVNKTLGAMASTGYVWTNENLKARSLGELHFLRALYYFDLVRQFGGVPLVVTAINSQEAVGVKRSSIEEVYTQIISDLTLSTDNFANAGDTHENGRASLTAANGLLGKVYLTKKDYTNAEKHLKTVINSGKHALLTNYADVFNPGKKDYVETLFSVQFSETLAELANTFIFFNAPSTSKGDVTGRPAVNLSVNIAIKPSNDLLNAFSPNDARYAVSIGKWTGPDAKNVVTDFFYCNKYKGPQNAILGWSGDNFPILRYSDILLMYAESLNELNKTSEAIPYVELVRKRAGLIDDISGLGKTELTSLIEKERRLEFCFENQRWYDLIRTNRAVPVMRALGKTIENYHMLSPIPGDQVLINKIDQNEGYGL